VQLESVQFVELTSARSIFVGGKAELVYFPMQIGTAEKKTK
jgi:hypothetical protein